MGYLNIYRRFRPKTFDDVKGRDTIVTILKNQIKNNKISNAYLFYGTRGTGKTSIAKVFAKAINCENYGPCYECDSCLNDSLDIIEIDAASNNSVNNIRELIEDVKYPPTHLKYKVYIIDEVHMLSQGAFNAFLKTLEEPPEYVVFILATTDYKKVPITISSRCQVFSFGKLSKEVIKERIVEILKVENIDIEDNALDLISKKADGALRDALSILDMCISFSINKKILYDDVCNIIGVADNSEYLNILKEVSNGNIGKLMLYIDKIISDGKSEENILLDFSEYMKNILFFKNGFDTNELDEETKNYCNSLLIDRIVYILEILSTSILEMKKTINKNIYLQMMFIRMIEVKKDESTINIRLENLENKIDNINNGNNVNSIDGLEERLLSLEERIKKQLTSNIEIKNSNIESKVHKKAVNLSELNNDSREVLDKIKEYINKAGGILSVLKNYIGNIYLKDKKIYIKITDKGVFDVNYNRILEYLNKNLSTEYDDIDLKIIYDEPKEDCLWVSDFKITSEAKEIINEY